MPPITEENQIECQIAYYQRLEELMSKLDKDDPDFGDQCQQAEYEAQRFTLAKFEDELEGVPSSLEFGTDKGIRMQYPKDTLEAYILQTGRIPWSNMNKSQKNDLLWGIGMDTKRIGYELQPGSYREGTKIKQGILVVSEERTDDEWIMKRDANGYRVSSEEAQEAHARYGTAYDMRILRGKKG